MPWNGGRVGVMLMEHQFGRVHIAKVAEAAIASAGGDSSAGATWADYANTSQRRTGFFVMAERMLSPHEQTRLSTELEGVDKNKMGEGESEWLRD